MVCKFFHSYFSKLYLVRCVIQKRLKQKKILDCTPPHRVTVVTDNTNFAETITPTAESATVLSQGI